jgi:hypothetical protein
MYQQRISCWSGMEIRVTSDEQASKRIIFYRVHIVSHLDYFFPPLHSFCSALDSRLLKARRLRSIFPHDCCLVVTLLLPSFPLFLLPFFSSPRQQRPGPNPKESWMQHHTQQASPDRTAPNDHLPEVVQERILCITHTDLLQQK